MASHIVYMEVLDSCDENECNFIKKNFELKIMMTQNVFKCRFAIIYIYLSFINFIIHKFLDNYLEDTPHLQF